MENTEISWTHNTFNPWWGCSKVSPACKHCYAESLAKRFGSKGKRGLPVWGQEANSDRKFFDEKHWREPIKWDRLAKAEGERKRVFCASMADVFEARAELDPWRAKLWTLIGDTLNLDWLLLTKRAEEINRMQPWATKWPSNVWMGCTAENKAEFAKRVPHLKATHAKVKFLSIEPLLEDLGEIDLNGIDWVIVGGESGHGSRRMMPEWARSVRDQCIDEGVRFHFKQWGEYDAEGRKVGKKASGYELDGKMWREYPEARRDAPAKVGDLSDMW